MKTTRLLQIGAAFAVALLPLSPICAQTKDDAGTPRKMMNIDDRVAKMKTKLELTDDQATKIKAIFEEQKAAVEPIMKDKALTKDQKREQSKAIMASTKTKVEAVLTPEQKTKMDAAKKARQDKKSN